MHLTYNDADVLFAAGRETPADSLPDRAPDMPFIGLFLASAIAVPLWGLMAWSVWALLS